jgi:hypothetical protein
MLKVCESDQISFLDEVAAGAQTIELAEQVVVDLSCFHQKILFVQKLIFSNTCFSKEEKICERK